MRSVLHLGFELQSADSCPLSHPNPLGHAQVYCQPCRQYFATDALKDAHEETRRHKIMTGAPVPAPRDSLPSQVFSKAFLAHHAVRLQELKDMRKAQNELASRNVYLEEQVGKMAAVVADMRAERLRLAQNTNVLESHLQGMQAETLVAFRDFGTAHPSLRQIVPTTEAGVEGFLTSLVRTRHALSKYTRAPVTLRTGMPCAGRRAHKPHGRG